MQTIRIYARAGGLVARFIGIPYHVETEEMRTTYPEAHFIWVR